MLRIISQKYQELFLEALGKQREASIFALPFRKRGGKLKKWPKQTRVCNGFKSAANELLMMFFERLRENKCTRIQEC